MPERAVLGELRFLGGDVALHVPARRIVHGPDAFVALLRDRIERPQQLAVGGGVRLHEPADPVLAAVGPDQHLVVDDGRRHRLAVALLGVGDLRLPQTVAALGVERDELGIERAHEEPPAGDRHAAVVRPAAERGHRPHLVLVVPVLLAGGGVDRVDVVVRRRQEHHAVDDDRRGLHRLDDLGLHDELDPQLVDVPGVDLVPRVVAELRVVTVRVEPVLRLAAGGGEHRLGHVDPCRHGGGGGARLLLHLRGAAADEDDQRCGGKQALRGLGEDSVLHACPLWLTGGQERAPADGAVS